MLVPGLAVATAPRSTPSDIIRMAAACGLRTIEWSAAGPFDAGDAVAITRVEAECRAAGIGVCGYDSGYRAGVDDPAAFTAALRTAHALGASIVHLRAGAVGSADASVADWARAVHALRTAVAAAADAGIRVNLRHEHGALTDAPAARAQLRREVHHDTVGFRWQAPGGLANDDVLAEFRSLLPALTVVQLTPFRAPASSGRPAAGPAATGLPAGSPATELAARAALWRPLLAEFGAGEQTRFALLGLGNDETMAGLRRDALTLTQWLPSATPPAAASN